MDPPKTRRELKKDPKEKARVYSKKHVRIIENRLSAKVSITGKNA
jgi:hypothetical protein